MGTCFWAIFHDESLQFSTLKLRIRMFPKFPSMTQKSLITLENVKFKQASLSSNCSTAARKARDINKVDKEAVNCQMNGCLLLRSDWL